VALCLCGETFEVEIMNRREFLRKGLISGFLWTTFAAFGALLLDVWLAAGKFTPAHWQDIGPLSPAMAEGVVPFPGKRVAIISRDHEIAALNLDCTHLGCIVSGGDQGFFCPCHGSEFGPMGEVYSGPASEPLKWHKVLIHNGRIWVRSGEKLDRPQWVSIQGRGAHHQSS
jgi:nitrite reductase/ring-hydroxylating ferredoxin subunit